jgi:hypothetical protein
LEVLDCSGFYGGDEVSLDFRLKSNGGQLEELAPLKNLMQLSISPEYLLRNVEYEWMKIQWGPDFRLNSKCIDHYLLF